MAKELKAQSVLFFAQFTQDNSGHVDFRIITPEGTRSFSQLEESAYQLLCEKSMTIIREPATEENLVGVSNLGSLKGWRAKPVRANIVTHSFWPKERPQKTHVTQDLLSLAHLARKHKRVPSEIVTYNEDREREAQEKDIFEVKHHVALDISGVEKRKLNSEYQKKKVENQELATEISELETALEQKQEFQEQIKNLTSHQDLLLHQQAHLEMQFLTNKKEWAKEQSQLQKQHASLTKQANFFQRKLKYLDKIEKDSNTLAECNKSRQQLDITLHEQNLIEQRIDAIERLISQATVKYQTGQETIQSQLQPITENLYKAQRRLEKLEPIIKGQSMGRVSGLKILHKMRVDYLQREEHYRQSIHYTKGKSAEEPIYLPTREAGLPFYVDEELVLLALEGEREKNYNFINYNCAASAKYCLLAGINPIKKNW
ncbi:hypothetical protein [Legionella hackeliae]|uniref:Uncharacterized protein n=1 Tax=Legionella hackeliae TaxID=449 RepID=A0A0A8UVB6_LEGHA|nr:hypothetical protein [Legionella hackeliae]KTD15179.1 hypothetical protein Lhac_0021 [Legionella hackeliae]CEK11456.1 protein of unknown function [Legionella hackeliae]STX48228.1 Uncharacterised protein [Legionella hackeliae]